MRSMFNDIGLVTAGVHSHLARLASIGNDSAGGGGSTTTTEDETAEEKDERERQEAIERGELDEADDDQPRGKRAKDAAAYRELQSDRDRLKTENEKTARENADFKTRLAELETKQTTRQEVNEQTNARLDRARQRAREVMAEVQKFPLDDPQRGEKIYEALFTKIIEDQERTSQEISQRTAKDTFQRERKLDADQTEAKRVTLEALEDAGLEPEDFELVEALAIRKAQLDPDWFKQVKEENQIDELVNIVKQRIVKTKRNSQEFKDEKERHRSPMRGVIREGSQTTRRSVRDQDETEDQGKGSMLDDLKRSTESKRNAAKQMLRQLAT